MNILPTSMRLRRKEHSLIRDSFPVFRLYLRYAQIHWPIIVIGCLLGLIHIKIGKYYAFATFAILSIGFIIYAARNKDKIRAYVQFIEHQKTIAISQTNKEYDAMIQRAQGHDTSPTNTGDEGIPTDTHTGSQTEEADNIATTSPPKPDKPTVPGANTHQKADADTIKSTP